MTKVDYRYDECGLDNVILKDLIVLTDDAGEECIHIPHMGDLHREIAKGIISKQSAILPQELRFLRTEMGWTQAELAKVVGKDAQTIGRWERGENPMEQSADMIVRMLFLQHLGVKCDLPAVEELARRTMPSTSQAPITIDASNPEKYQLLVA